MPVANPILARTLLTLQEEILKRFPNNGNHHVEVVLVCNASACRDPRLPPSERYVLICEEFRCWDCFAKIVQNQKMGFGISEAATDKEIANLVKPCQLLGPDAKPFAANLFQLKKMPPFFGHIWWEPASDD